MVSWKVSSSSLSHSNWGWQPWAAICIVAASIVFATVGRAAEHEVVGVLALAVDPDVSQQIGLTPNQIAQINQIVVDREAEVLEIASDFRGLTPDERFVKLAPFRKATEERGLAILSPQQRAKLEQVRFKRYGLSLLEDPVIADRLRIPPEQQGAIRDAVRVREEKLRQLGTNAKPEEIQKLDESLAALLGEPQRAALRAVLMGELPPPPDGISSPAPTASGAGGASSPTGLPTADASSESPQPAPSDAPPASTAPGEPGPVTNGEASSVPPAGTDGNDSVMNAAKEPIAPPPSLPGTNVNPPGGHSVPQPSSGAEASEQTGEVRPSGGSVAPTRDSAEAAPSQTNEPPPPSGAPSAPAAEHPEGSHPAETRPMTAPPAETAESPVAQAAEPAAVPSPVAQPHDTIEVAGNEQSLPKEDVRLRFNFRYQPWQDVLKWFAEQAGLSLVMETPPAGTFNYVDDRQFTPSEAIDLLNSVLLMKGYMLVRKERMLIVLNVDDGIPPNLVDTVLPEELDKRGDHELVSTLFQLQRISPEAAEAEVKKLLGPQGSVTVLPTSKQLLVTDTAGKLRTIQRVIAAIENPSAAANDVRVLEVNPSTVDQVLNIVRQMFQIPADQNANADGTLRFALDPSGARMLVTGTPDMLDRFSKVVQAADPTASGSGVGIESTPQLEVYPITTADPQAVLEVLQTLLVGTPDVRLAIDPKTGNLIAFARPDQHATIRATLQQLQGEAGQVEVIPLRVVDPQLAVLAINKLFGVTDGTNVNAPTVDADITTRQLLIRGSRAHIEQIRDMLRKMGEPESGASSGNVNLIRTIPMSPEVAEAMLRELQTIWPNVRENRLQVITPRSVSNEESPGPLPDQNGAEGQPLERDQLESFRIPLGAAGMITRRLVGGVPSTRAATRSGTSTTNSQPSQSQSPSTAPPQPPQGGWGPPGGFGPPGPWGPPGGFQPYFRRESDEHEHSEEHQHNSDRSTSLPENGNRVTSSDPFPFRQSPTHFQFVSQSAQSGDSLQASNPVDIPATGSSLPSQTTGDRESETETPPEPNSEQTTEVPIPSPSVPPTQVPPAPQSSGPPPVVVAVTPEGLVIASQDPDALNQLEDLLRRMATSEQYPQSGGPELVVYYLKHARAESAGAILDQILGGGTLTNSGSSSGSLVGEIARAAFGNVGGGLVGSLLGSEEGSTSSSSTTANTMAGSIQITPDSRLNALVVQAYPEDLRLVEEILRVLDRSDSPEDVAIQPRTVIIPVHNTQAEEIAQILRSVYQDRLVTGAGQQRAPSPQELIQLLRGGRGGSGGKSQSQEEPPKMSIGVDSRTNSLVVSAPEPLLKEVQELVEQLDQRAETESEETTQVVTLERANPQSIQAALSALLGQDVQIRGGTGSSSSRTGTTNTSTPFRGAFGSPFGTQGFQGFPGGFSRGFPGFNRSSGSGFTRGSSGSRRSGR